MPGHRLEALPYQPDGGHWLTRLQGWPHRVWLDSAWPHSRRGRWDIISADPRYTRTLPPGAERNDGLDLFRPLESLAQAPTGPPELPFAGGLIGAASYPFGEAAVGLHHSRAPGAWSGFYDWALLSDHHQQRSYLVAHPLCGEQRLRQVRRCLQIPLPAAPPFRLKGNWGSNLDLPAYTRAFRRVQDYIQAGDCYQINLARRFRAPYQGDPLSAYRHLRGIAAAPFSAYLELPDATLLSLSPERLLAATGGRLLTQPIKGTAARDPDPRRDRALADELLASAKNRAENIMIVDLLRNDLGRVARVGSVRAEPLLELQSFATVHHLVSSIRAELSPAHSVLQALAACFPGGSITGAPKRRAMQIIHELEPDHRDFYCGSVFHSDGRGELDSNITIRTLVCRDGLIDAWAGGGLVADSVCADEFTETQSKMGGILAALAEA